MKDLMTWVRQRPWLVTTIKIANKGITGIVYGMYPLVGLYLAYTKDSRLLYYILVPGISFVLVSLFRKIVNAPRPYEAHQYEPILSKDSKGESFPSRHVFSIFVIARGFYWLYPTFGLVFLGLGVILALCRVLGGVHYPKDVIVGALCGMLAWIFV